MKIGFLGPAYPLRGGIAQFNMLLALELKKKHEVKIFSFSKQYPKIIFPGKDQIDHSETKPDLEIEPIVIPYNPLTWFSAVKKIRQWQPGILILKYWIPFFAPVFGWLIRRLKKHNIRVIYVIDNIVFHEKWYFAEKLTKYALGKADVLITMSDSVNDDARRLLPKANIIKGLHPIYNCYDLGNYSKESAKIKLQVEKKKTILFFGYIKPYKGLDLLIRSFPLILRELPDAHLMIVGEVYGDDTGYFDLIEKLNLKNDVTFINRFATNEEVELYYKAADVLALPYTSATQSGVVQIAYDMELGAVATPVGSLAELVLDGKTGIMAEDVSKEAFSDAVVRYFELDQEQLIRNIKEESKKYSWEALAKLILNSI
ncbi:MAG: glycosyltransferase [Candidatus Cloacimonetes bacterium]|nr:glycosyltransferase [Candidatus Cloacimonadota bacterium]